MSTLLYRVGKTAFSKPATFIIGWVLILGIVISMISINGIHISSEMKIEGTESQKVLDQLAKELPAPPAVKEVLSSRHPTTSVWIRLNVWLP